MQRNYKKAFTALKNLGAPVIVGDDYGDDKFFRSVQSIMTMLYGLTTIKWTWVYSVLTKL